MEQGGRNQWQPEANGTPVKRPKQARTVAVDCDRLPQRRHGKEGVSGSSPEEGSAKAAESQLFLSA
jgi:hypothetical protein